MGAWLLGGLLGGAGWGAGGSDGVLWGIVASLCGLCACCSGLMFSLMCVKKEGAVPIPSLFFALWLCRFLSGFFHGGV